MKNFRARFVALCGLMVLAAAMLAPMAAEATCPMIQVDCGGGASYGCVGTQNGNTCSYSADCLNGGRCPKT
jgi:hypothetical protein